MALFFLFFGSLCISLIRFFFFLIRFIFVFTSLPFELCLGGLLTHFLVLITVIDCRFHICVYCLHLTVLELICVFTLLLYFLLSGFVPLKMFSRITSSLLLFLYLLDFKYMFSLSYRRSETSFTWAQALTPSCPYCFAFSLTCLCLMVWLCYWRRSLLQSFYIALD